MTSASRSRRSGRSPQRSTFVFSSSPPNAMQFSSGATRRPLLGRVGQPSGAQVVWQPSPIRGPSHVRHNELTDVSRNHMDSKKLNPRLGLMARNGTPRAAAAKAQGRRCHTPVRTRRSDTGFHNLNRKHPVSNSGQGTPSGYCSSKPSRHRSSRGMRGTLVQPRIALPTSPPNRSSRAICRRGRSRRRLPNRRATTDNCKHRSKPV